MRKPSTILLFIAATLVAAPAVASGDSFTAALERGPVFAAVAAFIGGFLVSLTPCVYPMVAVTVSVFGARQTQSRWQGIGLSAAFVAGIVAMFVPLGVVAGLTGSMFGAVLQSRWVVVGISVLFIVMATALFGAFELALPSRLTNRLAEMGGIGYRGAFVLGGVCGLIASPCTGPVLTGILAFIAQSQNAALGAAAMAAFSLGLGIPFFVVGAFAIQLPKSGSWMVRVKSLLGLVLVVVALYYLGTTFPQIPAVVSRALEVWIVAGAVLIVGLLMGAIHRDFADARPVNRLLKGTGLLLASVSAFVLVTAFAKPSRTLTWEEGSVAQAMQLARQQNRPVLVDFTATWCGACKEIEKHTFADERVAQEAGRFIAVKVDATHDDDPAVVRILERFEVRGLPTLLLFDAEGKEVRRLTDFIGPTEFLAVLAGVE